MVPTPVESPLPAKKGKGDKKKKEEPAKVTTGPAWATSGQGGVCGPVQLMPVFLASLPTGQSPEEEKGATQRAAPGPTCAEGAGQRTGVPGALAGRGASGVHCV